MTSAKTRVPIVLVGFFLLLVAFKIVLSLRHEPWRDETVIPLMLQNVAWREMISLYRGVMFPLYDSLLKIVYDIFGYSLVTGRTLAVGMSLVTSYLILFRLELPKRAAIPLLLTNYLFYEYTVFTSRHYVWTTLLTTLFTYLEIRGKPFTVRALVAGLLILGHPVSFVIGGGYLVYLVLSEGARILKSRASIFAVVLVLVLAIVDACVMIPPYRDHIAPFQLPGPKSALRKEVSVMAQTFFGITENWGNYQYLRLSDGLLVISLGLVLASLFGMRVQGPKRRQVAAVLVGATVAFGGSSSVFVFRYGGDTRHFGLLYLAMLSFAWIAFKTGGITLAARRIPLHLAWALSCACLITSSVVVSAQDLLRPFSNGARVAVYLRQQGVDGRLVTVVPEHAAPSIAFHLPHPLFYNGGQRQVNRWAGHNPYYDFVYKKLSLPEMLRAIPDEILRQDPVIIINENKGTALDVRGRKYRRISDFQGAIVRDENYFIYDTAFAATPPGARGEK